MGQRLRSEAPVDADAARAAPRPMILNTKIVPPAPVENLLERPRLHRLMDEAVGAGSLIVSAPAGSGKTQLVRAWADRQRHPRDLAWITVDDGDTDPARFLRYLVAAVSASVPCNGLDGLVPLPRVPMVTEACLTEVAHALEQSEREVVLVVDNFESLVGSPAEEALAWLLQFLPERLRLVVLSRVVPSLGQLRLSLHGRVRNLTGAGLRMTPSEIEQVLLLHGVELAGRDLDALHEQTMGWATGVRLMAAVLHDLSGPVTRPGRLGIGYGAVEDYLISEVFESQSPELQQFLLRVATVNPVCGGLADELTGADNGHAMLADLHRRQVFLDRADDLWEEVRCTWYRWHPMFLRLLRSRLQAGQPHLQRELHITAARWLALAGVPAEAIRHAVVGGDRKLAAGILAESWLDLVMAGETAVLRPLVDLFDEQDKASDPELALACAVVRSYDLDVECSTQCAMRAVTLASEMPLSTRVAVEAVSSAVRLHLATLTAQHDRALHDSALTTLRLLSADAAVFRTEAERTRRTLLMYQVGAYEYAMWDVPSAKAHLEAARATARALALQPVVEACEAQLALIDLHTGDLTGARARATGVLDAVRNRGPGGSPSLAQAYTALGGVSVMQGLGMDGLRLLARARAVVHPLDLLMQFRIGVLTHAGLESLGNQAQAARELSALEDLLERWPEAPARIRTACALLRAQATSRQGNPAEALAQVESLGPTAGDRILGERWRPLYAELLLSSGRPDPVRALLRPVLESAVEGPNRVMAHLLSAWAAEATGMLHDTLVDLDRAVECAAPEHVVLPFLVHPRPLHSRLEELLARGTSHRDFVVEVLDRMRTEPTAATLTLPVFLEPLTAREQDVLRVFRSAQSNEETARRLAVSPNTLRTHLKHINHKLGTHSGREAVARARLLGLI